jgi:hypothetical protein
VKTTPKTEEPQTTALAPTLTPMAMIDRAISSGAGIETLERLMSLQERWEANEARRAYDKAMSLARAEIKPILKTRPGPSFSGGKAYKYEDLADIAEDVDEKLSNHGLSYRWETVEGADGRLWVICVVSHSGGHREAAHKLPLKPDMSGSKNEVQALGSAITYLQRYTLKCALGLAAAKDDDAHAAGPAGSAKPASSPMSDAQYESLLSYMKAAEVTHPEKILERYKIDKLSDLTETQYLETEARMKDRIKTIKERKKEAAAEAQDAPAQP